MVQENDEITYIDIEVVNDPSGVHRVKKQMWDGTSWRETTHYRVHSIIGGKERAWLRDTFGPADVHILGQFWSYRNSANYTVMDEPIYMMYCLKWGNR